MTSTAALLVIWTSMAGLGLPLGIPPAPENPVMQQVAPEKCVLYATWAATAQPDGKSANHTEQLLAEPEVRAFVQSLEKTIGTTLNQYASQAEDAKAKQLASVSPLWIKTLTTRSAAIFLTKLEMTEPQRLTIEGGMLIEAGGDAAALAQGLTDVITTDDQKPTPVTIGRATFQRFTFQNESTGTVELSLGAAGPYVLIGIGKNSVEGMFERLRTKQTPAWLTNLQKRLPVERRASMSYLDLPAIVNGFLPLAGPEGTRIADSLGIKQLGPMESVTGLDKDGLLTRSFMAINGRPTGLLTLLGGGGIAEKDVAFLPKDATFATAFSFKTQHVYDLARHLIADNVPNGVEQFDRATTQFEEAFGQRLEQDVLQSFGDVWTVSAAPADGWLGVVATVQVRDRAKLDALVTRVQAMLSDVPPERGAPRIEAKPSGDQVIHMVVARGMPLQPAWCITDDRLIIGLSPQAVRSTLNARATEIGLFEQPHISKALADGNTIAVSYQDTAKLFETTYSYLTLIVPMAMEAANEASRQQGQAQAALPLDLSMLPSARSIHRHLRPGISITRRVQDGVETESRQTFPMPSIGTSAPVAVALLLPAVQASREAARRMQSSNNLKQILLAMHNYHSVHRGFPPAYNVDKEGKPLLSWRVHILPFIEEEALYRQFHLDEPWDSEHNRKLIEKMPKTLRSPKSVAAPGMTNYLGIASPGGVFDRPTINAGRTQGLSMASITDGTSNTLAVVEANDASAVIWTKPADFVPEEKDPHNGLLGMYPGGFQAGFVDGSVRFVAERITAETLRNLFHRADGNVIDRDGF